MSSSSSYSSSFFHVFLFHSFLFHKFFLSKFSLSIMIFFLSCPRVIINSVFWFLSKRRKKIIWKMLPEIFKFLRFLFPCFCLSSSSSLSLLFVSLTLCWAFSILYLFLYISSKSLFLLLSLTGKRNKFSKQNLNFQDKSEFWKNTNQLFLTLSPLFKKMQPSQ